MFAHRLRRSISKGVTYRIRYGNGYARSVKGKVYQDRYKYFVPTSIDHPNGEASRQTFKAAVSAWQTLPDNEKKLFNQRATRRGGLAGYHLFIREYMKQNYTGA